MQVTMNLIGGFGGFFLVVYVVLFAAIMIALYWIMRYFRQLTRVNEVKEKLLSLELRERSQAKRQSNSETT